MNNGRLVPQDQAYAQVVGRLPAIVDAIVDVIRREVPQYSVLPRHEQCLDLHQHLDGVMEGMRRRSGPDRQTLDHAESVGARRSDLGLALKDVVEAYHIAYREIWDVILRELEAGAGLDFEIAREVTLLWTWFHRITAAVTSGFSQQQDRSTATRKSLVSGLFSVLLDADSDSASTTNLASDLDFDPAGAFTALSVETARLDFADALERWSTRGMKLVGNSRDLNVFIVLMQGDAERDCLMAIAEIDPPARVGIGLPRSGLEGARLSILDSADALGLSRASGRTINFAADWLSCVAHDKRRQLEAVLRSGRLLAKESPHLAEAVRVYLSSGFSLAECGRRLTIHPNTAKYRIERWQEVSGWDMDTVQGIVASAMSVNSSIVSDLDADTTPAVDLGR